MIDAAWVEQRLLVGEDSRVEFKSLATQDFDMDATVLAREIAGFANSGGGYLILGIEDDGAGTGAGTVPQADALMQKAVNVCRDRNLPQCGFEKLLVQNQLVLVIEIPGFGPDRPYLVGGVFYVRQGNETRQGSRDELLSIAQSFDYHFDEQPVVGASIGDLDHGAVDRLFSDAYGFDPLGNRADDERARLLKALNCLSDDEVPTVSGILMFGDDPQRWLPDARVSAVHIAGTEMTSEFADRREATGRLSEQFQAALEFLGKHIASPSHVEGWSRVEQGIPTEILREGVLNALGHRDYRMAAQTRIVVFDDRVEITNPGGLLNRLTLDSIRLGMYQRRNPRIASLLALAHSIRRENLGMGVREMLRLARERGLPEPAFSVDGGHFQLVIKGPTNA